MTLRIDAFALDTMISDVVSLAGVQNKAASMAINKVVSRQGFRMIQDDIMDEVAFPRDYLSGDRLLITQLAKPENPVAVIRARKRATSMARFAGGAVIGRAPVSVEVSRGKATLLKKAWLVRLKAGKTMDEDRYNIGLAVRLKAGERVAGKYSAHSSWFIKPEDDPRGGGVALLMGPSVDQVFRSVADDVSEPIGKLVAAEYWRNMERLL